MAEPAERVLVIDDLRVNLRFLSRLLLRHGFAVQTADSGAEAFRLLEAGLPQLILADIRMPGMDGYEFCRRLKADPRTREIPVLFISSLEETRDKLLAFEAGAVDYVTNPFQAGEVIARVRTHLALHLLRLSLGRANVQLEQRVAERTRQLEESLDLLRQEVVERRRAEAELQRLTEDLEQRVSQRTAQLEAANQELEAFSYSVSHDLRAPLRGIDGFSQVLQEDYQDRLDAAAQGHLARIRAGTGRMGELIEDLLKLAKVGRGDLNLAELDLSALGGAILAGLAGADPGRRLQARIQPGLTVRADARLLRVALENLLGNAWKFTSGREAPVIELGEAAPGPGERIFFVRDNGAGFPMEQAGRLFASFQRLHSTAEFAGTGIGLTIVQRIVHRHGGRIWGEGEPGRGATFWFSLPEEKAADRTEP